MKKGFSPLFLLLIVSLTFFQTAKSQNQIENNLVPAVLLKDSPNLRYDLADRMEYFDVPGVSIAVFRNGNLEWTKGYGSIEDGSETPVTTETKFQAASISKAVTALGVLKLVENYELDLDADINEYLKRWQIDTKDYENKVSIRTLLNHTAGVNNAGFEGYSKDEELPSLIEVLEGKGKSPAVKVMTNPGEQFSYSGGGYLILQLLVEDVSGKNFEDYYQEEVFTPLEMTNSTFVQTPEQDLAKAHNKAGETNPNGWNVFTELAAAGLWTTPTDLAKFAMEIEAAQNGKEGTLISRKTAKEMLGGDGIWGLGVQLLQAGNDKIFMHSGANPGFKNIMLDDYSKSTGIVILTNSDQGVPLIFELLRSFFDSEKIEETGMEAKIVDPIEMSSKELQKYAGKYHFERMGDYYLDMTLENGKLKLFDPNDGMVKKYVPLSKSKFISMDGTESDFVIEDGKIKSLQFTPDSEFKKVEEGK